MREKPRAAVSELVDCGFHTHFGVSQLLTGLKGIPVGGLRNPDANPADVVSVAMCQCRACIKAYR